MLTINSWFGRLGNNILQIINCIHYAIYNKHNIINFPNHYMMNTNKIIINNNNKDDNNNHIINTFFYLEELGISKAEPYIMKEYFQKYVKNIINLENSEVDNDDSNIYIHIRSGDIFSMNPHPAYVQPPLIYYKNIIKDYKKTFIIAEDNNNPCVNNLLTENNVSLLNYNNINKELFVLSNVNNLIIGFGTYGFLLYLMNKNLKRLYIPEYFINELPTGSWGDIELHIIKLPDYIKVGEWKNTNEQREYMINYDKV